MFPATRQRWPSPRSRCPAIAVVVLLPLVPVMQATRREVGLGEPQAETADDPDARAPTSFSTAGA